MLFNPRQQPYRTYRFTEIEAAKLQIWYRIKADGRSGKTNVEDKTGSKSWTPIPCSVKVGYGETIGNIDCREHVHISLPKKYYKVPILFNRRRKYSFGLEICYPSPCLYLFCFSSGNSKKFTVDIEIENGDTNLGILLDTWRIHTRIN